MVNKLISSKSLLRSDFLDTLMCICVCVREDLYGGGDGLMRGWAHSIIDLTSHMKYGKCYLKPRTIIENPNSF